MRNQLKSFCFWFTAFALAVIAFHLTGLDDKNLLLFFTSPMLWLYEAYPAVREADIPRFLYLLSTVFIWFLAGLLLDRLVARFKTSRA
ncbi:hypothetical protein [Paenibacillus sp. 1P07SE]|uniref:hypothetical protein n=1 Tax=Paenibacillus sp. 1P07SE TaxID=3132209 RepID=UPI0039A52CD8